MTANVPLTLCGFCRSRIRGDGHDMPALGPAVICSIRAAARLCDVCYQDFASMAAMEASGQPMRLYIECGPIELANVDAMPIRADHDPDPLDTPTRIQAVPPYAT